MTTRSSIETFVAQPAIALVGISRCGRKFGNLAYRELSDRGYRVYAIHPAADVIGGIRCYRSFKDLPEKLDAALVVLPPAKAVPAIKEIAASGIRNVWLQQGAESEEVLRTCHALGLNTISGE